MLLVKNDEPADATDMGGICLIYTVDVPAALELGLGKTVDTEIGYDNPTVTVPKATTLTMKDFAWDKFIQGGWDKNKPTITGPKAAAQLVSIKFKIQAATGTKGNFNIKAIGALGKCDKSHFANDIDAISTKYNYKATTLDNTVYDISGNLIGKNKTTDDLMKLPKGLYIINTGSENFKYLVK